MPARTRSLLRPDLAVTVDHELGSSELLHPHRAKGMELRGAYPDLRAEPELIAVVEAGRGIDQDYGGIDQLEKLVGTAIVRRNDCLGMLGTVGFNVLYRCRHIRDYPDRKNEIQKFHAPVIRRRRLDVRENG